VDRYAAHLLLPGVVRLNRTEKRFARLEAVVTHAALVKPRLRI